MLTALQINRNPNYQIYAISGHYGTGKTVLASEAVKMILSKLKETSKDVDVHVLTFGSSSGNMNYKLLMKDLKNKWFADQDVKIQHFVDFLKTFMYIIHWYKISSNIQSLT